MQVSVTKLGLCNQKEEIFAFVKGKLLVTHGNPPLRGKFAGVVIRESLAGIANFWEHQQRRKSVFYPLNDCPDIELEEYAYPGSGGFPPLLVLARNETAESSLEFTCGRDPAC